VTVREVALEAILTLQIHRTVTPAYACGVAPVPVEESLEIFAFMDAALRSK